MTSTRTINDPNEAEHTYHYSWITSVLMETHPVLKAVTTASWQRADRSPVILHSDRGTQFTNAEYQQFLKDHHIVSSMSDIGHCGDNAAVEGFFGKIERERIHRHRYLTLAEAQMMCSTTSSTSTTHSFSKG